MSLPLLPDRTCGGCVECCRVIPLNLPELAKPTGELCGYCVDGAGCSVPLSANGAAGRPGRPTWR